MAPMADATLKVRPLLTGPNALLRDWPPGMQRETPLVRKWNRSQNGPGLGVGVLLRRDLVLCVEEPQPKVLA